MDEIHRSVDCRPLFIKDILLPAFDLAEVFINVQDAAEDRWTDTVGERNVQNAVIPRIPPVHKGYTLARVFIEVDLGVEKKILIGREIRWNNGRQEDEPHIFQKSACQFQKPNVGAYWAMEGFVLFKDFADHGSANTKLQDDRIIKSGGGVTKDVGSLHGNTSGGGVESVKRRNLPVHEKRILSILESHC